MSRGTNSNSGYQSRDARLRAALRANLARRKAQSRVRNAGTGEAIEGEAPAVGTEWSGSSEQEQQEAGPNTRGRETTNGDGQQDLASPDPQEK